MSGDSKTLIKASFVQDACKDDINSRSRRNVCKYVIRSILKAMNRDPSKYLQYIFERFGKSEEEFSHIQLICKTMERTEKDREAGKSSKDYVKVIESIVHNETFHAIFNKILADIVEAFNCGIYGRIGEKNRVIYKEALEHILKASIVMIEKAQSSLQTAPDTPLCPAPEPQAYLPNSDSSISSDSSGSISSQANSDLMQQIDNDFLSVFP